jgi:mRNA interferase RelE/StbE
MKRLEITKDAHGFLKEMQVKQFRQVGQKVLSLLVDPKPNDAAPLRGYDYWRTDVGEYRIVYKFDDETVYIVLIAKRNDDEVYKKLGQK